MTLPSVPTGTPWISTVVRTLSFIRRSIWFACGVASACGFQYSIVAILPAPTENARLRGREACVLVPKSGATDTLARL